MKIPSNEKFVEKLMALPSNEEPCVSAHLCACAYVDDPDQQTNGKYNIESAVQLLYPTYKVVWSASITPDYNYAYIVQTPDNQFYLAIRGSLPFEVNGQPVIDWGTFDNWFHEDFDVFGVTDWEYASGKAYVSNGAYKAFGQIQEAQDIMGSGLSAYAFLYNNAVSKGYPVYVTGHSLGGNIADTYASYFASQLAQDGLSNDNNYLFTFAAPAAGNDDFMNDLQGKFPPNQSAHYEIDNDIIPMFPVYSSLHNYGSVLFNPKPQAAEIDILLDVSLSVVIKGIADVLSPFGYAQTPATTATSTLNQGYTSNDLSDWFYQASFQHSICNYIGTIYGDVETALSGQLAELRARATKAKSAFGVEKCSPLA